MISCSECTFKRDYAGAQYSGGTHIYCLRLRGIFESYAGCEKGKEKGGKK